MITHEGVGHIFPTNCRGRPPCLPEQQATNTQRTPLLRGGGVRGGSDEVAMNQPTVGVYTTRSVLTHYTSHRLFILFYDDRERENVGW